ncbi:hypothetical protein EBH_0064140 [Eimeria brunetti]|uniref:Uncharacterized protein n=1 Tax=Eimeria brunetti TaxID=51314 RepID=U6L7G5_9EIME|nr:hypothetical protein EBH_0064140 [Eimeria brunetti]
MGYAIVTAPVYLPLVPTMPLVVMQQPAPVCLLQQQQQQQQIVQQQQQQQQQQQPLRIVLKAPQTYTVTLVEPSPVYITYPQPPVTIII